TVGAEQRRLPRALWGRPRDAEVRQRVRLNVVVRIGQIAVDTPPRGVAPGRANVRRELGAAPQIEVIACLQARSQFWRAGGSVVRVGGTTIVGWGETNRGE